MTAGAPRTRISGILRVVFGRALRSIAGEPVPERTPLLPVELIVRDSCGAHSKPTIKERH